MDVDEPTIVFCRPCVEDLEQISAFCSPRCFEANFRRHQEDLHGLEHSAKDDDMIEEGQIRSDAEDEPMDADMKPEEHIISLREAIADWQKKTEASVS